MVSHFAQVLDSDLHQFFTLLVGLDLVAGDHLPNCLEHAVRVRGEVLSELKGVEVDQTHDLASSLSDLLWDIWQLWIVLVHDEETNVGDGRKLLFVVIRKLLLTQKRFNNVKDRIHHAVQSADILLTGLSLIAFGHLHALDQRADEVIAEILNYVDDFEVEVV